MTRSSTPMFDMSLLSIENIDDTPNPGSHPNPHVAQGAISQTQIIRFTDKKPPTNFSLRLSNRTMHGRELHRSGIEGEVGIVAACLPDWGVKGGVEHGTNKPEIATEYHLIERFPYQLSRKTSRHVALSSPYFSRRGRCSSRYAYQWAPPRYCEYSRKLNLILHALQPAVSISR